MMVKVLSLFAAVVLGMSACAADEDPIRVAFSFDDGSKDHHTYAAKMLEDRGWRGMFCIVTDKIGRGDRFMTWENVNDLIRRGHEIASHTVTHANLGKLSKSGDLGEVRRQVVDSREEIVSRTGVAPRVLCLPWGSADDNVKRIIAEAGMKPTERRRSPAGAGFPSAAERYREWRKMGLTGVDLMFHGIRAEGGGWKAYKTLDDFAAMLDGIAALEREGKVIVTDYEGMRSGCTLNGGAYPHHGELGK